MPPRPSGDILVSSLGFSIRGRVTRELRFALPPPLHPPKAPSPPPTHRPPTLTDPQRHALILSPLPPPLAHTPGNRDRQSFIKEVITLTNAYNISFMDLSKSALYVHNLRTKQAVPGQPGQQQQQQQQQLQQHQLGGARLPGSSVPPQGGWQGQCQGQGQGLPQGSMRPPGQPAGLPHPSTARPPSAAPLPVRRPGTGGRVGGGAVAISSYL